jgi:hypothetical protein
MKKALLFFIVVIAFSCSDSMDISNVGCYYGYPSDGDPYEILGCGSTSEHRALGIPSGYSRVEWQPIEDCILCERRNTRGKD